MHRGISEASGAFGHSTASRPDASFAYIERYASRSFAGARARRFFVFAEAHYMKVRRGAEERTISLDESAGHIGMIRFQHTRAVPFIFTDF